MEEVQTEIYSRKLQGYKHLIIIWSYPANQAKERINRSAISAEHKKDLNDWLDTRATLGWGLDNRSTAGTVEIQACGVSSDGVVAYNAATSHDTMKQEAQSSLAVG